MPLLDHFFTFLLSSTNSLYVRITGVFTVLEPHNLHTSKQSSAAPVWTAALLRVKVTSLSSAFLRLTDLLQQFILNEFKLHADGHFGDELVASFLGHLFAISQVDVANAPAALEIGQRLVCDPVADCKGEIGLEEK